MLEDDNDKEKYKPRRGDQKCPVMEQIAILNRVARVSLTKKMTLEQKFLEMEGVNHLEI